ncbi:MAG: hypothetical protein ACR2IV_15760, partial [Bryobacteraceae bacterium]
MRSPPLALFGAASWGGFAAVDKGTQEVFLKPSPSESATYAKMRARSNYDRKVRPDPVVPGRSGSHAEVLFRLAIVTSCSTAAENEVISKLREHIGFQHACYLNVATASCC